MWRVHTSLLVILAVGVSSLFASQGQQSKSPVNCPKYSAVSSAKTLSRENKVPVSAKQNSIKQTSGGLMLLDGVVEVSSDITTNQIWTAGNTYHITADISVQALLVIEPGTMVMFASGTSMYVNNGGTLISCGTPDNPIIYTSDSANPWYGDYYCAIYVDETASSSTKITYSYIEYAEVGIWVMNNRLNSPIENNCLYSNSFGILEYGTEHTDIQNNLIYASYNYAIEVHMSSYDNLADSGSHILIQNNTCDYYQDVGILVLGVESPDQAGQVNLVNNIVSGAYQYGLVLANGYMYYTVDSTGYYNNAANTYDTYDQTNPVIETTMPYVNGTGTLPICYLNPNSVFVNASDQYIEQTRLIGKTTDINGFPDSNKADLGFHYPNWHFSNAGSSTLTADFDNSYTVDFNDLSEFTDYWLYDYNDNYNCWWWDFDDSGLVDLADFDVIADYWLVSFDFVDFADFARYWRKEVNYKFQDRRFDLNGDGFVNFKDFAMFADQWRQTTESTNPPIAATVSGEPNNLTGKVSIGVNGYGITTEHIFLLIDGEYIKELVDFTENGYMVMDTRTLRNGTHTIKAVAVDANGLVTLSTNFSVNFANTVYCVTSLDQFGKNEDYHVCGLYSSTENLRIKLMDMQDNIIWVSNESPAYVSFTIPSSTFTQQMHNVVMEKSNSAMLKNSELLNTSESWETIWERSIAQTYDPNIPYKYAIFLPDTTFFGINFDCRKRTVAEIVQLCESRQMPYVILYRSQCTWSNFESVLSMPSISYAYMAAHGGSWAGNTQRTRFRLTDGDVFSYYDERLPERIRNRTDVHYMQSLGLGGTRRMRIVHIDGCIQSAYIDMARQWIDTESLMQLFLSWRKSVGMLDSNWDIWSRDIWLKLAEGNNYFDAQNWAATWDPDQKEATFILGCVGYFGNDQITFTNQGNP